MNRLTRTAPPGARFVDRRRGGVWLADDGHGVLVLVPSWRSLSLDDLELLAVELRTTGRRVRDVQVATPDARARILRLVADGAHVTPAARRALAPYLAPGTLARFLPWLRTAWGMRR